MSVADLGYVALVTALGVTVFGAVAAFLAGWRGDPGLRESARRSVVATAVLISLASLTLIRGFVTDDFSIRYVAENSSRDQPWYYTLAAFYGSQAGSLLFWAWTLALLSVVVVSRREERERHFRPYVTGVLLGIQVFFLSLLCFLSNPLEQVPFPLLDGRGLNPLLKDPGMLIHPPLLLGGYMSFSVPYAYTVAALLTGRVGVDWTQSIRRWTLLSWTIQSMGLLMGAWWAYRVLGWGGYWGWDPVENVALLPWLTSTAFLHSILVQEQRSMLKVWNVSLAIATFALAIFGTFVVRSGIITSVHSFAFSSIGPAFLGFLAFVLVVSLALLFARLPRLRSAGAFHSVLSREVAFLVNNLLFVGIAFATFWGTIFPLVSEALWNEKTTVGPPFFNQVNGPLFLALMVLMGVGPLLAWGRTAPGTLFRSARAPVVASALVAGLLWLAGLQKLGSIAGMAACTFVLGTIAIEYARGIRARRRATREPPLTALNNLLSRHPRRYGGYLVHLGVALLAVGVTASTFYQRDVEVALAPGESASIGRYRLTYERIAQQMAPDHRLVFAQLTLHEGDRALGSLRPEKHFYRHWEDQPSTVVAVTTTLPWLEDVYVFLAGWEPNGSATFHIYVNPLVTFVWLGGAILLVGSVITMWPRVRPERQPAHRPLPEAVAHEV